MPLHIATEGPPGRLLRAVARRRGWPFATAYHRRFPEPVHARTRLSTAWSDALRRRLHNAGHGTLAPTPAIVDALRERGIRHAGCCPRGVARPMFSLDLDRLPGGERTVFRYVGRRAVEKQVDALLKLDLPGETWVAGMPSSPRGSARRSSAPPRCGRCPLVRPPRLQSASPRRRSGSGTDFCFGKSTHTSLAPPAA